MQNIRGSSFLKRLAPFGAFVAVLGGLLGSGSVSNAQTVAGPAPAPAAAAAAAAPAAPATTATGTIIPLYSAPGSGTWAAVAAAKQAHPSVPILAVVNPNNGPGTAAMSDYMLGIQQLNAAGVKVIGYVPTGYGARTPQEVQDDIWRWKNLYTGVTGIFFDQMANQPGKEKYFGDLTGAAKGIGLDFTIGNPGSDTGPSYIGTVDTMVIYQSEGLPQAAALGGWHSAYDRHNFGIIPYGVPSVDATFITQAKASCGYIYLQDDRMPNPWDTLPSYFDQLVAALETAAPAPAPAAPAPAPAAPTPAAPAPAAPTPAAPAPAAPAAAAPAPVPAAAAAAAAPAAPATTATGTIVPLYSAPGSGTWAAVAAAKQAHPSVPILAVVNPNNGPGTAATSDYQLGIQQLDAAGVKVIGYVPTGYGARTPQEVQDDIWRWKNLYSGVTGIFFDEMANQPGKEKYYGDLTGAAKGIGFDFTIGNPGSDAGPSYIGTVDTILIYENEGLPQAAALGGWHSAYDRHNFGIIPYGVPSVDTTFITQAKASCEYIYLQDDRMPNPWDTLPSYFDQLLAALQ
jgi:hypothetical protein